MNLTQKELAKAVGVHSDTIYLLENDKNLLHAKYMIKIEEILNCEICKYDKYLNFAKHTALNISNIRKARGISKKDLAAEFNVSISTINSWESGRSFIPRKLFYLIFSDK